MRAIAAFLALASCLFLVEYFSISNSWAGICIFVGIGCALKVYLESYVPRPSTSKFGVRLTGVCMCLALAALALTLLIDRSYRSKSERRPVAWDSYAE